MCHYTRKPQCGLQLQPSCDDALTEKTLNLVDALEELDDVQSVYTNAELSDLSEPG